MMKSYQIIYLVNFVWGNNMINLYRNENNDSLTSILVTKKDLEKIVELERDVPESLKELLEKNRNLKNLDKIEVFDINDIAFIYQLNWILDDFNYGNFSEIEIEIAIKYVSNKVLEFQEQAKKFSKDKETLQILKNELKKYKYMLTELRKLLTLRRKEPPKRI